MKPLAQISVPIAACALLAATLGAAAPFAQSIPQQSSGSEARADDPVAPLFAEMCGRCHDAARIVAMRRTRTGWEDVINMMIEKGATGTERDFEKVYDYLLRHYGVVSINLATTDDLTTIVGLSKKDADAIVAYRKEKGPFADLEALKKVPGIDVKKLEEHKDAVTF